MQSDFSLSWHSQKEWGWQVALDLFCGGLGAGTFLMSLWVGSRAGAWLGVLLVAFAGVVLLSHLGRPGRFWRALTQCRTSWIARGAWSMSLFVLLAVLSLLIGGGAGQVIVLLAGVFAVLVILYPGFVLSASPSIPFWNSPLLPMLFLAYSLSGAVLLLLLLGLVPVPAQTLAVRTLALPLLGATLILVATYLEIMNRSQAAAREAVQWLLRGRLAGLFLWVAVGVGLVAPLVLLVLGLSAGLTGWLQLAALGGLIGGYLFRHTLLQAGIYGPPV